MKRAIFKIGGLAVVESETEVDSFLVRVDVDEWAKDDANWDFEYFDRERLGVLGTTVTIKKLHQPVANAFAEPTFKTELIKLIARDYAFFVANGFEVFVGADKVPQYRYELKQGGDIVPAFLEYDDEGVHVKVVAGLADELDDEIPDELRLDQVEKYGWFVVCNGRVVLAADKSASTVWGDEDFPVWHPQYNGFAGYVFFTSDHPRQLPWNSTKREVDTVNPAYRRAIGYMKEVTRDFIAYSSRRKNDPVSARQQEHNATSTDVSKVAIPSKLSLPHIRVDLPKRENVTITYSKPKKEVKEIAQALGDRNMSARDVGKETFAYFQRIELGK